MRARSKLVACGLVLTSAALGLGGEAAGSEPAHQIAVNGGGPAEPVAATPWDPEASALAYDPAEVSARAAHDNVSVIRAMQRLRNEDTASAMQEYAKRRWPTSYAGTWLDSNGDRIVIGFTEGADDAAAALRSRYPQAIELDARTVQHSMQYLQTLHSQMRTDRRALQPRSSDTSQGAALPLALRRTAGDYGLDIDVQGNAVRVYAAEHSAGLQATLRDVYGSAVALKRGVSQLECARTDCRFSMRGGLTPDPDCSVGFTAYGGSGRRFFLTAGHCASVIPNWSHAGASYGQSDGIAWDAQIDGARVVDDTATNWSHRGLVWVSETDQRAVKYYQSTSGMVPGTQVGKSGRWGTTRGYVRGFNYSPPDSPTSTYVVTDYCSYGGDSGGAIFRNNTAWGLHGGGTSRTVPCGHADYFSFFMPIEPVLNRLSVFLITE